MESVAALTERARAELLLYQVMGERNLLDRAIEHFTAAAAGRTPPVTLANLAGALLLRFEIEGRRDDLTGAVAAAQGAVDTMDPDDPTRAGASTNLGAALLARYERGGPATDLDRAVAAAADTAGRTSPDPGATSSVLAMTLLTRYERDGDPIDLEHAVEAATAAVEATPDGDSELGARLSNQAVALRARYELTGSAPDLDATIRVGTQAVEATAATRPERAMYLSNLAGALCTRIERVGPGRDVRRAVELARRAVDTSAASSPHQPARLSVLGLALRLAAEYSGDAAALDAAVDVARSAAAAAGTGHPERLDHLVNLAIVLRLRAERATDVGAAARDLDEAVDVGTAAAVAGSGRPAEAACGLALGRVLAARLLRIRDRRDLWRALAAYRRAASSSTSPALQRLAAAHLWGSLAREHGCLGVALAGFGTAVELLPVAAWHGLDRRSREHRLAAHASLATEAAEAAIAAGRPDRAVELVDRARTVLWSQLLRLRGDLGALADARPDLAARLDRVRAQLDRPPAPAGDARRGLPDRRRQDLAGEWDALVAEARRIDGFAHFLAPRPLDDLMGVTVAGPVVVVVAAGQGCHALLLRASRSVEVLALPGLTRADVLVAADRLRTVDRPDMPADQRRELVDDLLDMLWRLVVRPVLDVLGPVERIRWCPTGPMMLLPLHAARQRGDPSTGRAVLGSYTVALEPMLRPRRPGDVRAGRVLAVGVPHGWGPSTPLPAATREVERITAARSGRSPVRELVDGAATCRALLTALPAHDEVHLACHVVQDPADPATAGFVLADGVVTIEQLVELNLSGGELAVLPGCGTAVGPARLLDEAVHVAAALQVAGYRHVVATLWSVPDAVGPPFAAAFHEALAGGTGPDRVHTAMCAAVAAVQERHARHTDSWAAFVHIGP